MTPAPRHGQQPTPAPEPEPAAAPAAPEPAPEPAAPEPAAPTSSSPEHTTDAPSLDSAPYAETHEPDGWDQPQGRPPLGELAEQSAPKEN